MFPFKLSSVFKSRWMALFFAANILWFADDVVQKADPTPVNEAAEAAQVNRTIAVLPAGQQAPIRTLETFGRPR